jgi:hypothetical protein
MRFRHGVLLMVTAASLAVVVVAGVSMALLGGGGEPDRSLARSARIVPQAEDVRLDDGGRATQRAGAASQRDRQAEPDAELVALRRPAEPPLAPEQPAPVVAPPLMTRAVSP